MKKIAHLQIGIAGIGLFLVLLAAMLSTREKTIEVGLDRVSAGSYQEFLDKRIGLIAHAASVTGDGRHVIDVMSSEDLKLVRLFTPEHGLRSRAAAGEKVESGKDPISGLPVVSLYGDHKRPQPEDLKGLDVLVFDLQGAGVRFYTYVSTLILSLEAAADAELEFVVLDRPNPLGGERIEGPVSASRDLVPESFVNLAPGPLVHGLTLGEMARFVNRSLEKPARLTVIPMSGWKRSMTWSDTGLHWVPPSPNLRSPDAALAYPGTALLEATNVSEGRGTPGPFLVFGAPWLPATGLEVAAPGFILRPTRFTPVASLAAPNPKYLDQACHGMEVLVEDPGVIRPYQLGVSLLATLQHQSGFEWKRDGAALTWLLGTPRVLEDLRSGCTVQHILDADRADHIAWREARRPALLY